MNPKDGGVCQAVRTIVKGLEALNVKNEIACFDNPSEVYLQKDLLHVNALGRSRGPWAYNSQLIPWLVENIDRFNVVIVHGLWLYHGYGLSKALKKLSSKKKNRSIQRPPFYFVMPHGMLDPYFQRHSSRRLKALRNWIYWQLIEHKLVNNAAALLFTCEEEKILARESFTPYQPKKELVIGLGVEDPPIFQPHMKSAFERQCPNLEGSYILFLSRIHPKKGVNILIKAYSDLAKSYIESSNNSLHFPHLVIAGPLDTSYSREMQQYATEILRPLLHCSSSSQRLLPRIHFPGMLQNDAKWGAFYGCKSFVLPSHQENFGIAVVEALACGKSVLISNKVNIWREIEASGAGIIDIETHQGTKALLVKALAQSSNEEADMHRNAISCFKHHFGVMKTAQRLLDAIKLHSID